MLFRSVGGTLNFQTKANAVNKSIITVAPEIGMSLNEQFGVGAVLSYTASQDVYNEFKINPYLRYNALEIGKVKVFVDGGIYYIKEQLLHQRQQHQQARCCGR